MKLIDKKSPNCNERKDGALPIMLVLHYTGTKTAEEADAVYMTPDQVSPHYMIDQDANVTRYVDETLRAWHAGASSWAEHKDINSISIGIEVVNGGHEAGLPDFPEAQISGLIELINDIRSRWNIPDHMVLGHSDIAPGRKIDPGEHFPWEVLHRAGIGLLPRDSLASGQIDTFVELYAALKEWGYDYSHDFDLIVQEFRRHYIPHDLGKSLDLKKICAAIHSLHEQKKLTQS